MQKLEKEILSDCGWTNHFSSRLEKETLTTLQVQLDIIEIKRFCFHLLQKSVERTLTEEEKQDLLYFHSKIESFSEVVFLHYEELLSLATEVDYFLSVIKGKLFSGTESEQDFLKPKIKKSIN